MAKAAEEQGTLNILGLVLLLGTLGFTGWAAVSARRAAIATAEGVEAARKTLDHSIASAETSLSIARTSARAAVRSARVAEDAMRGLERPYLFIEKIDGSRLVAAYAGYKPAVEYTVVNYGKTPAILRAFNVRRQHDPGYPLRLPPLGSKQFYSVVEPGKRLPWPGSADDSGRADVDGSSEGQRFPGPLAKSIVFHGSIFYEGPTGALYRDRFCFRAGDNAETFHPDGGDEYNRRETLVDPAERRRDQEDS